MVHAPQVGKQLPAGDDDLRVDVGVEDAGCGSGLVHIGLCGCAGTEHQELLDPVADDLPHRTAGEGP
jgi:hypothetical protein